MTQSLSKKAGRGLLWRVGAQVTQQGVQAGALIVLARLLQPREFGIYAMAIIFTEFIQPLRQWGFQAVLIQKQEIDEEYRSTVFWAILMVGILLFIFSMAAAPLVGYFFKNEAVPKIIFFLAFMFLLSPFGAVQWALLTRELNFKVIAIRDMWATLIYGAVACTLALNGFGVWSIVCAALVRELFWSLAFWFMHKWRPSFIFHVAKFKEILKFGSGYTSVSILNYLHGYADNLIVGKFMGADQLGIYSLAFNTVSQPQTKLVSQISAVNFPVYALIQSEEKRFLTAYRKTLNLVLMIVIPILSILFVGADDFVRVFYGDAWLSAVTPIRIMCLYGILRTVFAVMSSSLFGKGKPGVDLKIMSVRTAFFIVALFYAIPYGIVGVSIAVLLSSAIMFFPAAYVTNRELNFKHLDFYKICGRHFLAGAAVTIITHMVMSRVFRKMAVLPPIWDLILCFLTGCLTYLLVLAVFFRADLTEVMKLIKPVFSKNDKQ